jgi:FeS assembly protein IscX
MAMTWRDTEELARALALRHPEKDPLGVPSDELRLLVVALPDFADDPGAATLEDLEEIQSAWYEAHQE